MESLRNLVTETVGELSYGDMYKKVANTIKEGYLVHGTDKEFLEFDPSMIRGGMRAEYGYGIYFTDTPYKALEYGYNIIGTKKDLYNFLDLSEKPSDECLGTIIQVDEKMARLEQMLDCVRNVSEYERINAEIERLKDSSRMDGKMERSYHTMRNAIGMGLRNMEQVLKTTINNLPSDHMPSISELFLRCGYDGVKCENQYVIFNVQKLNANLVRLY